MFAIKLTTYVFLKVFLILNKFCYVGLIMPPPPKRMPHMTPLTPAAPCLLASLPPSFLAFLLPYTLPPCLPTLLLRCLPASLPCFPACQEPPRASRSFPGSGQRPRMSNSFRLFSLSDLICLLFLCVSIMYYLFLFYTELYFVILNTYNYLF